VAKLRQRSGYLIATAWRRERVNSLSDSLHVISCIRYHRMSAYVPGSHSHHTYIIYDSVEDWVM